MPEPSNDHLTKMMRQAIETAALEELKIMETQLTEKLRKRLSEIASSIAINVMQNASFSMIGNELTIRIQMPKG